MKNITALTFLLFGFIATTFAQFTTVSYDMERNWFNEGQALPAEKSMVFKGMIPGDTEMVELSIQSSKRNEELYQATWFKTNAPELSLIVPFKLRSSDEYDFVFNFFKEIPLSERKELEQKILTILHTYIEVNLSGNKSIKFVEKKKKIIKEMNSLTEKFLADYRSKKINWKPEFSEMVALKLEHLEKADLDKEYVRKDSTMTKLAIRSAARQNLINNLQTQIDTEVRHMLDEKLYTLTESRFVDDYVTEEKQNSLTLNAGFGGVYLSGDWSDLSYGSSPYLGIAFPLGNSILGSKFLSNSSVTLGVFTQNFEDENGNEVTGFLVDRPIYLGLDRKLFKFIRVNVGAAFLEGVNVSDVIGVAPTKKVIIRPFVGLSARIDLSIGFGK